MLRVECEPTIPVVERQKHPRAFNRAKTACGAYRNATNDNKNPSQCEIKSFLKYSLFSQHSREVDYTTLLKNVIVCNDKNYPKVQLR